MKKFRTIIRLLWQPRKSFEYILKYSKAFFGLAIVVWLLSELFALYTFKQPPINDVIIAIVGIFVYAGFMYAVPKLFSGKTDLKKFIAMYGCARIPYLIVTFIAAILYMAHGTNLFAANSVVLTLLILFYIAMIWNAVLLVFGLMIFYKMLFKNAILAFISAILLGAMSMAIIRGVLLLLSL